MAEQKTVQGTYNGVSVQVSQETAELLGSDFEPASSSSSSKSTSTSSKSSSK